MSALLLAFTRFPNNPIYDGLDETTVADFDKLFLEENVRTGNNPWLLRKLNDEYFSAGRVTLTNRIYSTTENGLVHAVIDYLASQKC